ncbi:hypothetical protein BDK51DRAFT_39171 [Blyttiomyces helicus]|uniref:Uncharacterized protein n=1 Tax=Blyttiomyces helicus TaxID=388810 RepID=A0A4P9W7I3_9FUNG|nr:hypothetical protein BDK51DRAFT_39171 [Blyttiomyces helicus]|eukprot:RKO88042.1 hypothetical protein BDK51DRAFT_39171 [Blyttiomyces helicus]
MPTRGGRSAGLAIRSAKNGKSKGQSTRRGIFASSQSVEKQNTTQRPKTPDLAVAVSMWRRAREKIPTKRPLVRPLRASAAARTGCTRDDEGTPLSPAAQELASACDGPLRPVPRVRMVPTGGFEQVERSVESAYL